MVNGVCHETCHFKYSKIYDYQPEDYEGVFAIADKFFASMGVTSVHDAGGNGMTQLKTLIGMDLKKKLNTRVYMFTYSLTENRKLYEDLLPTGIHSGFGSGRLRIGSNKVMLDGSSNTPSASVREPYCHMDDKGLLSMDQDELNEIYIQGNRAGFQNTAHAVGDNAVDMVLIAHEKALLDCPREDARHRIEHCAIIDDDMIERIKRLGVTPSLQPIFMYEQGERYLRFYGEDRVSRMMAARKMKDAGIIVSFGTDCPVYYSHPMINLFAACTRISKKGNKISPEQCVTVLEAVRMYTYNSAYASYQEDSLGSLEVGKLADMVVLSKPILSIDPESFREVAVDMTISGGKIVFEA
jgi:predicted amidohydrolase YtcJ